MILEPKAEVPSAPPNHARPLDIPRDATGLFQHNDASVAGLAEATDRETAPGAARNPRDVPINLSDPAFWAYWIGKSRVPIERAYAGSCLESHFAARSRPLIEWATADESRDEVTVSLVGDLMCTPGLVTSKDRLYEHVADLIFGADISYANLESTLTTQPLEPLAFRMDSAPTINVDHDEYTTLVTHRGRSFDVVQLANNHILDRGLEGINTTCTTLRADGIVGVGVSLDDFAPPRNVQITNRAGLQIGWVAHTFSINFKPIPPDPPNIVNVTPFHLVDDPDTRTIEDQIRYCRELGCDLVVVGLHWGLEFEIYPHPDQLKWARRFAEVGADIIVGHHPHVVQPLEVLELGGTPPRCVPVIYSLGNLTPVFSHPACAVSLVARITLARDRRSGSAGRVRLRRLEVTPVALLQEDGPNGPLLRLWRLRELLTRPDSAPLAQYVEEMGRYIDIALGPGWRA